MTVRELLSSLKEGTREFGLLGEDGVVHGHVAEHVDPGNSGQGFCVVSSFCVDGNYGRGREDDEALPWWNCLRCVADETGYRARFG